jgi:uncharacterized protein (DUF2267 family)
VTSGAPGSRRAIGRRELVVAVQTAGAMPTMEEAERAALATLGELGGCLSWHSASFLAAWLPGPFRGRVDERSYDSSMCRFAAPEFVAHVAEGEGVSTERAARHVRAVLLALDRTLPAALAEQVHEELATLWSRLVA